MAHLLRASSTSAINARGLKQGAVFSSTNCAAFSKRASRSYIRPMAASTYPREEQPIRAPLNEQSVVLLVGASRGLGLEYAKQLLDKKCRVFATHRGSSAPDGLQALAQQHGDKLDFLTIDVGDDSTIKQAAEKFSSKNVKLTHLIVNSGILPSWTNDPAEVSRESLLHAYNVNSIGPFSVVANFLPFMKIPESPSDPSPVVGIMTTKVSSIFDNTSGGGYAYRSSKTALNMLVKSMAIDLKPKNIAFVLLHPGYVRTDMTKGNGLIDPPESVAGMLRAVEATSLDVEPARFVDYKAEIIPW